MAKKINRVVFLLNEHKAWGVKAACAAAALLEAQGVELLLPKDGELPGYSGHRPELLLADLQKLDHSLWPELAVIFGGDGTLIAVARAISRLDIPLVGVNMGNLGFLMSLEPEGMPHNLLRLVQGEYFLEPRMQIYGRVWRNGQQIAEGVAQNDIVINNGNISRMIDINVWIDGTLAVEMKGDGLIVATPTGSTAYSLSAGGSIVLPETEVMLITPVAAHSLYSRPMVVSAESDIKLRVSSAADSAKISYDGQQFHDIANGDVVEVQRFEHPAIFVWPERGMFLKKLKSKLLTE